ncbi:MAG: SRPBCC family protein [Bacteroidota bacterium]
MKILKIILSIILFLFLGWIAICIFSKDQLIVEESMQMNCSSETVFEQINDFENWVNWSPWHALDPNMKMDYVSNNTAGLGAKYKWVSEHDRVGVGSSEIVESVPNKRVKIDLDFGQGPGNYATFLLEDNNEGCMVTWKMEGAKLSFWFKAFNTLMQSSVEDSYKTGLTNLSTLCNQ